MRLTPSTVRRIASEVLHDARRRRFAPPSSVLDEEQVERYEHRDLLRLHDAELHVEIVEAGTALRTLAKNETVYREWWSSRFAAVLTELRRRRAA